jgi:hypothetical protein
LELWLLRHPAIASPSANVTVVAWCDAAPNGERA